MSKKTTTRIHRRWMSAAAAMISFLALATSCAQTPRTSNSQTQPQASPQIQQTPTPSRPAKIMLNGEEMGTTADLSGLNKFLTQVMKGRDEQTVTKPGTDEIERTVFVTAQPSLKLGEVLKVIQVVSEAGASPVKLPVRVNDVDRNPSPLTLSVIVGDVEYEGANFFSDGMPVRLYLNTAVNREEKDYLRETHITVEIRKDGEYLVNENPIAKSALSGELQARLKEKDKSIIVLVEKDPKISFVSLAELAQAAFDAQATELQLRTLAP